MKASRPQSLLRVELVVEEPLWRKAGGLAGLRRAAEAAQANVARESSLRQSLTILLTDDARIETLNARFRGKNKPTNVLSFPATGADRGYLGDIAIAYGVSAQEAAETGKSFRDHVLHLTVHGVLHLLGYDHETAREARIMEPLEITILAELGVADPYVVRPAVAATVD
jgi:probable rRNA maturation factor